MNIWLGTLGFVDTRYSRSGKDHDGYVLCDCRLSIVWEETRVSVAEGFIAIIDGERCVFWVQGCGCNGCRGSRGGEVVCYDCQGEQGYVVFLGQADRGRGGAVSGSKSTMEGCEGYTEIYGIIFDGGLDSIGIKDCVLIEPSQWGALRRGWHMRLTMARTLDRSQAIFHVRQVDEPWTYAHT